MEPIIIHHPKLQKRSCGVCPHDRVWEPSTQIQTGLLEDAWTFSFPLEGSLSCKTELISSDLPPTYYLPHTSFFYLHRYFRVSSRPAPWRTLTKQQILLQSLTLSPDNLSTFPLNCLPPATSIWTSPWVASPERGKHFPLRLGSSMVRNWPSKKPKERKQILIIVVYFMERFWELSYPCRKALLEEHFCAQLSNLIFRLFVTCLFVYLLICFLNWICSFVVQKRMTPLPERSQQNNPTIWE